MEYQANVCGLLHIRSMLVRSSEQVGNSETNYSQLGLRAIVRFDK